MMQNSAWSIISKRFWFYHWSLRNSEKIPFGVQTWAIHQECLKSDSSEKSIRSV